MRLSLIISPAKRMDVVEAPLDACSLPAFLPRTELLMQAVQAMDLAVQRELWHVSEGLALLNHERFEAMDASALADVATLSPAVLSYQGIQYQHLAASVLDEDALAWLEGHLRIVSGFYGLLRPSDGVVPYRLEMQARLAVGGAADLYGFWGSSLAEALADECDVVVNLASVEYARAVTPHLEATRTKVVTCLFGEVRDGRLVQRATEAKAARGTFARWCAERGLADVSELAEFRERGYALDGSLSTADMLVFSRVGERCAKASERTAEAVDAEPKPWWLYLLRCADGSLYTGIATDVDRRCREHNAGTGAKYTRSRRPCEVVYREACADKSAALKRELQVKALSREQKLKLVSGR